MYIIITLSTITMAENKVIDPVEEPVLFAREHLPHVIKIIESEQLLLKVEQMNKAPNNKQLTVIKNRIEYIAHLECVKKSFEKRIT